MAAQSLQGNAQLRLCSAEMYIFNYFLFLCASHRLTSMVQADTFIFASFHPVTKILRVYGEIVQISQLLHC